MQKCMTDRVQIINRISQATQQLRRLKTQMAQATGGANRAEIDNKINTVEAYISTQKDLLDKADHRAQTRMF